MFHQTMFSYLKLCIQHPGDIFLWQSCYFVIYSIISLLLFPHFAITCQATASQKYNYRLCFLPPFTHCNRPLRNTCFLQQVLKRSLWCNHFRCPISLSGRAVLSCAPCTCTSSIKAVVFSPVSPLNNITVTSLTRLRL